MRSPTLRPTPLATVMTYRRDRLLAVVLFGALVVAGCTASATTPASTPTTIPSASPASPASSRPALVTPTDRTEESQTTGASGAVPARARCTISPASGLAGSRTTLTCGGFAPSESVAISFLAEVLTTKKATADGDVTASFPVPSGFAGSHYPGRQDTFRAKGHQSGKLASATFTVTG